MLLSENTPVQSWEWAWKQAFLGCFKCHVSNINCGAHVKEQKHSNYSKLWVEGKQVTVWAAKALLFSAFLSGLFTITVWAFAVPVTESVGETNLNFQAQGSEMQRGQEFWKHWFCWSSVFSCKEMWPTLCFSDLNTVTTEVWKGCLWV